MAEYPIAVIVGSLRRESFDRKLAHAIVKLALPKVSFEQLRIDALPPYNQDEDANQAEPVKRLKSEMAVPRSLLFVTAEYNRSLPGVLKNAIDIMRAGRGITYAANVRPPARMNSLTGTRGGNSAMLAPFSQGDRRGHVAYRLPDGEQD